MKGKYLTTILAVTGVLFCGTLVRANQSAPQNLATQMAPAAPPTEQAAPTPQTEIMTLIQEAVQFIKDNGEEEAFKLFNNPQGPFSKGNTYVFAIDFKGNILAHGSDADMIGKNHYDFKDSKGRSVVRALIEKGRYGEGAWVNYFWKNPATNTEECKSSFVTTFDKKFVIGAGYFHPLNAKGQCING